MTYRKWEFVLLSQRFYSTQNPQCIFFKQLPHAITVVLEASKKVQKFKSPMVFTFNFYGPIIISFSLLLRNNQYVSSSDCMYEISISHLSKKITCTVNIFFINRKRGLGGGGGRPLTIFCRILIFFHLPTLFISIRRFEFPFVDVLSTERRPGITQLSQLTPSLFWRKKNVHWIQTHRSKGSALWGTSIKASTCS